MLILSKTTPLKDSFHPLKTMMSECRLSCIQSSSTAFIRHLSPWRSLRRHRTKRRKVPAGWLDRRAFVLLNNEFISICGGTDICEDLDMCYFLKLIYSFIILALPFFPFDLPHAHTPQPTPQGPQIHGLHYFHCWDIFFSWLHKCSLLSPHKVTCMYIISDDFRADHLGRGEPISGRVPGENCFSHSPQSLLACSSLFKAEAP